jgi:RNA recognition motif-containing protein
LLSDLVAIQRAREELSIPEEKALMGRRLYVGNLAWTVTDQDLQDVFSEAGTVDSSQVIIDRATNRSRGFGFVEMATDEAAETAIKTLNGRDIKGRPIRVNEAQARSGGGGGHGPGSGRDR